MRAYGFDEPVDCGEPLVVPGPGTTGTFRFTPAPFGLNNLRTGSLERRAKTLANLTLDYLPRDGPAIATTLRSACRLSNRKRHAPALEAIALSPSSSGSPFCRCRRSDSMMAASVRPLRSASSAPTTCYRSVRPLRLRDVHLESVTEVEERLGTVAVVDQAIEGGEEGDAVGHRVVGDVRMCLPAFWRESYAERAEPSFRELPVCLS